MSIYSNPAITFSEDTESVYYQPKKSEGRNRYLQHNTSEYPRRKSGDAVTGDNDGDLATLTRIRQAISAATMDHTQRYPAVSDLSVSRSRSSSRCRTHDRYSSIESQEVDSSEISLLGSDLHESHMSASRSRRRSRSTDSNDSVPSISRSPYSTTPALPIMEGSSLQHRENGSAAYIQSTGKHISRRSRPYASYYTKEISTSSDCDFSNPAAFWDSLPSIHPHRPSCGTPEPSIYEEALHPNDRNHTIYTNDTESDYGSERMNNFSRPEHFNKQTLEGNADNTVEISRTPSLTSTQNSPLSTPSSYSESSFITSTVLADYSIAPEETSESFSLYNPSPHPNKPHPTQPIYTAEEPSITHHFSKPRRFFRTRSKPRARATSNADPSLQLLSTSTNPTSDRHELISPPVSPLSPSISLSTLHFSTTTDSHSSTVAVASTLVLPARSCSMYADAGFSASFSTSFSAGLSFGIPAPELGIRLASLETMAERQEILLVRKGSVTGLGW